MSSRRASNLKLCTKCKAEKPRSRFNRDRYKKDGLDSWCRRCRKRYVQLNRERIREKDREYKARTREKRNAQRRERIKTDPEFRITVNLRRRVLAALGGTSKSAATLELLGCTPSELRAHLERQFVDGMTWENYGTEWHVDHIKPCAAYDLTDEMQQRECFHHMNLQPLWAAENLRKNAKWPHNTKGNEEMAAEQPVEQPAEEKEVEVMAQPEGEELTPENVWTTLDVIASPFEWPDELRNIYTNGTKCSLWGRSVGDMTIENLILFVGFLDQIYTNEMMQNRGALKEMVETTDAKEGEEKEKEPDAETAED